MSKRRLTSREFFLRFRTPQLAVDHYGPWLCAVGLTLFQIAGFFPLRYLVVQSNPFLGRAGFVHDFQFYLLIRTVPAFNWGSTLGELLQKTQHHWVRGQVGIARSNLINTAGRNAVLNAVLPVSLAGYQLFLSWQYDLPDGWKNIASILLWGLVFNMVFQVFLLCWIVGLFLPKSARGRVQVTENVRL